MGTAGLEPQPSCISRIPLTFGEISTLPLGKTQRDKRLVLGEMLNKKALPELDVGEIGDNMSFFLDRSYIIILLIWGNVGVNVSYSRR